MHRVLILVGLPGSGKSTVLEKIKKTHNVFTYDFDEVMPKELRSKMRSGIVITDAERISFFKNVIKDLKNLAQQKPVIAGCVLVKEKHRKLFLNALPNAKLIELNVPLSILQNRLQTRKHAFFNPAALGELFKQNEPFTLDSLSIDGTKDVEEVFKILSTQLLS